MKPMEIAKQWATDPYFDEETHKGAYDVMQREDDLMATFGSELHFGTGGLRGILGVGTARMNRYTVARATLGLANYLLSKSKEPSVAIAHDSRHGSEWFTEVAACVFAQRGVKAYVFPELAPTPMLSFAVRALHCDAGVMITASHNPAIYNGYKVYGADGCQITDQAADDITAKISEVGYKDAQLRAQAEARKAGLWLDVDETVRRSFEQGCLFCRPDPNVCEGIHVAYTPLHGTGLMPVRAVLKLMQGVTVTEVEAQCEPDGDFPTCPKPNPELDETLAMGLEVAKANQADLLLATDPDCDRVGVAVRTPEGDYARLSGNEVGLLLLDYILGVRKAQGTLPYAPVVVKTIVTSDLATRIAASYGVRMREVLTGFKYIGEVIGELEKRGEENRFVFGFEESCGYLAGTHVRDKDGVMACMLVCELAQACKASSTTIYERLQKLYETHGYMETALMNFDIAGALPMEEMTAMMTRLRQSPPQTLAGEAITRTRDYLPGLDGLPKSNVLSFETAEGMKAIVRPSGTEPKVKVYLSARGKTREDAQKHIAAMQVDVNAWMGKA